MREESRRPDFEYAIPSGKSTKGKSATDRKQTFAQHETWCRNQEFPDRLALKALHRVHKWSPTW
ncbi:hypothetical protein PISMIDRAFT_180596 [Pisolithus microcarpus 441]|uniref:Unplaced genomic scaffold scaffold_117, whole genome shotgun sequence n=1 Tax=Pisolithus microcarpus 441 TaxID=765257 RepID=A0A0C9YXI1_9AGAM|nr:hypothetical protein PISMIDRAFT_180596 [Pisolithus microcarpus 441]